MEEQGDDWRKQVDPKWAPSQYGLRWGTAVGMVSYFKDLRWLSISGINNVISLLDDIEAGKVRDVDFIECLSCLGGCTGGALTVENTYVARSRLLRFGQDYYKQTSPEREAKIKEDFEDGYYDIKAELQPRVTPRENMNIIDAVRKIQKRESLMERLPGLNCGLCGSPTCKEFAEDVSEGEISEGGCVFLSRKNWEKLYKIYNKKTDSSE
jgi:hypothetical protein